MKMFTALSAAAAALMLTTTASFADGHSPYNANNYEVAVPAGMCPEFKREMARWAYGKTQHTTLAVPTSRKKLECGEAGEPATGGISQDPDANASRRAALEVCNANRGSLGRCVVVATVRLKQ